MSTNAPDDRRVAIVTGGARGLDLARVLATST